MEVLNNWKGLNWPIYDEYEIVNIDNKEYLTPVFIKGIKKSYNPNNVNSNVFPNRSVTLFLEFAKINPDKNTDILKMINQYGLLWDERHSTKKGTVKGDLLDNIKDEIFALKKALEIYRALKGYKIDKLFNLIKLKDNSEIYRNLYRTCYAEFNVSSEITDFSSKNIKKIKEEVSENKTANSFIITAGIKKEPVIEIDVEKYKKKETAVIRLAAYLYLIELITDRIKRCGGAIPYYVKITESEKNFLGYSILPSFECSNLAAALWIQFYNIISTNQEIAECKNCGEQFKKEGKTLYCSKTCKNTKNKRDSRRKQDNK